MEVLDAAQVDGEGEVVGGRRYGQVSGGGGLTVHCVKEQSQRGATKSQNKIYNININLIVNHYMALY